MFHDANGTAALVTALQNDASPVVRKRAAWALGEMRANSAVAGPALQNAAANDASPLVRSLAAAALTRLSRASVPASSERTQHRKHGKARGLIPRAFSFWSLQRETCYSGGPRMRTFKRGRALGAGIRRGEGCGWGRLPRGAGGRLPDQRCRPRSASTTSTSSRSSTTSASATRRPATSIDHGDRHRAGQPGSDLVRGRPEAARRAQRTYGSYPHPLLLLKALPEEAVADPLPRHAVPAARSGTPAASRSPPTRTPSTSSSAGSTTAPTATASLPARAPRHGRRALQHRAAAGRPPARPVDTSTAGLPDVRRRRSSPSCCSRARSAPATARRRPTST